MKLNRLLLIAALGTVSVFAAPLTETCTPTNAGLITGGVVIASATSVTCGALAADAGDVLTGLTLQATLTWSDSAGVGTTNVSTIVGTGGVFTAPLTVSAPGSGIGINSPNPITETVALSSYGGGTFTIGVPTTTGGVPNSAQITIKLVATESPIGSATPEPTSMLLFGSGFLALGLVARARKSRS